ncbi:MAG: nicotinamidase [Calditrichaeota bacterium]|nr:nicotinamidase [Calditrichota bacterium]
MSIAISQKTALIAVDIQNDFCEGGALPVPNGDKVVPILNRYQEKVLRAGGTIVFTRDWHPANHCSFKEFGGIWPVHCVQNTKGAQFHPGLNFPDTAILVSTATHPEKEAYSGFEGTHLADVLKKLGIDTLLVGGLATDYCVKATALDGVKKGFTVYFLEDASRGVNVHPDDSQKAIEEMKAAGIRAITLSEI